MTDKDTSEPKKKKIVATKTKTKSSSPTKSNYDVGKKETQTDKPRSSLSTTKATGSTDKPKKKLSAFGQAFADARKAGKSTFEWNGKKYTTEMASGKKKKASKPKNQEATEQQTRETSPAPMADRKTNSAKGESAFRKESDSTSEIVEAYSESEKARKKRKGEYA